MDEKVMPNYEAECVALRRELKQLQDYCAKLEETIREGEKHTTNIHMENEFLRGQIKAFEFCVKRGRNDG